MHPVTSEDLQRHEQNMKEYIKDSVGYISKDVADMKRTLYGKEGRNGVVGDVNDLKASRRIFKWFIGLGSSGGAIASALNFFKG